jgi:beta-lactam-binding protein with PASTA domain
VGLDVARAKTTLTNAGFTSSVDTEQIDSAKPAGTVIEVEPGEGTAVPAGTRITLRVSDGDIAIPDVRGLSEAEARKALVGAGFSNIRTQAAESDEVAEGEAVGTEPGANNQASASDEIVLLVAVPIPPDTTPTSSSATGTATATPTG